MSAKKENKQQTEGQQKKKAFVIMPIGEDNSPIRRSAEGIYRAVIKPVLNELGYDASAAHEISESGSINKQIISRLLEDDIVIANLTGLNPNVMYEIAVRHATGKPIVNLCERGTELPFDLNDERTIFYTDDMHGVLDVRGNFENHVKSALAESEPDNPIYRAKKENIIANNLKVKFTEDEYSLYTKLAEIEQLVIRAINVKSYPTHDPAVDNFSLFAEESGSLYVYNKSNKSQNVFERDIQEVMDSFDIKTYSASKTEDQRGYYLRTNDQRKSTIEGLKHAFIKNGYDAIGFF